MAGIEKTDFHLPGQVGERYNGKVGDTYSVAHPEGDLLVVVRTDRISAYDHVLHPSIPDKGHVLNEMSTNFLSATASVAPNWLLTSPDPNVSIGRKAKPFPIEMIMRGALMGSAWKAYDQEGLRELSGATLPEGMSEFERFNTPLVTPTTKAEIGQHDAPISPAEIVDQGLATREQYDQMEHLSLGLFAVGQAMAMERGLYLADTKYEFGTLPDGKIIVIDEVHTPDSSRYFPWDGYNEYLAAGGGRRPEQLSKEFVREKLKELGFSGEPGQIPPELPLDFVAEVSTRYRELYETMLGKQFRHSPDGDGAQRLQVMELLIAESLENIDRALESKEK